MDRLTISRQEAWIGDAVLSLYARRWVLANDRRMDADRAARLSSNQFLSAKGNPTEVEAEIGRIFESEGLDAAFAHIETRLLPLFLQQEKKRLARRGWSSRGK